MQTMDKVRRRAGPNARRFELCLATDQIDAFSDAAMAVGWTVDDTGHRVTTDAGIDAEAVVAVTVAPAAEAGLTTPGSSRHGRDGTPRAHRA